MSIVHDLLDIFAKKLVLNFSCYYKLNNLKTMSSENNLEKSSQDYKKSQYGSWYKKSAENKKKAPDPQENSFINRLKKLFKK